MRRTIALVFAAVLAIGCLNATEIRPDQLPELAPQSAAVHVAAATDVGVFGIGL